MFEEFEILFSGATRLVTAPLSPAEEALVQRSLAPEETLERYLRGRGERVGWMLWALTPQRLLCVTVNGKRPLRAHVHGAVVGVEAIRGKWGATLHVHTGTTREVIFAADLALSDDFVEALVNYTPNVTAPPKLAPPEPPPPERRPASLTASAAAAGQLRSDAESVRLVEALREAASLREKGLLTDEEYAALKRRLLGT
jgi:hypothetical protein